MGKQYLDETTTGALMDGWLNKLVIGEVLGADVCGSSMRELTAMANKQIALWNCPHYKEFRLSRVNETIRREVRTDERTIKNPFKKEKT